MQVEINGIISFSEPVYHIITPPFPEGAPGAYFVAPYSDDIDLRLAGDISYEVHSRSTNNPGSDRLLDEVSGFVEDSTGQSFEGSWMLVAEWREVHPWPHGDPTLSWLFPESSLSLVSEFGLRHLASCSSCLLNIHIASLLMIIISYNTTDEYFSRIGDNKWK